MDHPNARRAQSKQQFNTRQPKAGPLSPAMRQFESPLRPASDAPKPRKQAASRRSSVSSAASMPETPRKIATNSRVRQEAQNQKTMFLAFVNDALTQKANVRAHDLA
jgi:RNA polymerase I-specific transcription initiation factor RRN3